jgi:hypothetical protein
MAQHSPARAVYDLLSSMRFAVSLLTVLAIASVVGTVLKQAEPYANYISQFGPFWFPVFEASLRCLSCRLVSGDSELPGTVDQSVHIP